MSDYCTNCGGTLVRGNRFCNVCGVQLKTTSSRWWLWLGWGGLVVGLALVIILVLLPDEPNYASPSSTQTVTDTSDGGVEEIMEEFVGHDLDLSGATSASVVNVICPYAGNDMSFDSAGGGGSGVVLHSDGVVITNSHVIPQDAETLDINEEGCIILFPDTKTGLPMQAYLADPIVIPGLSDDYDLAMLIINEVYKDKLGNAYGTYPNTFPAVSNDSCEDEDIKLGEKVTVFGYPTVTGGYSLTITDGIISSFSPYGVVISAKIDLGNSGGLAVDEEGCFMGVPTLVKYGDTESYGVIVPASDVVDFINQYLFLLEEES